MSDGELVERRSAAGDALAAHRGPQRRSIDRHERRNADREKRSASSTPFPARSIFDADYDPAVA